MSAHANCTHEKTKSARAACRRAAKKGLAPVAPKIAPLPTEIQTPIAPTPETVEIAEATFREMRVEAQIDAFQLAATIEKVDKINARAAKKGLAGTLGLSFEEVEVSQVNEITKITETWTEYKIILDGIAPAYNGWEFIAKLDWDANAGLIVRNMPGKEGVDRDSVREGWCDHCKTTRRRTVTYVVKNQESGQTLQVGSSCLKDFTGHLTTIAWPTLPGDEDEEREFFGGRGEREYAPLTVLAVAWACIKLEGYKPASYGGNTTRGDVMTALNPSRSKLDREWAEKIRPLADEAMGKAEEILAFLLSDDFAGDSDYVLNLKAIAAGKMVSARNIGILASAPQALARFQERSLIREREDSIYKGSEYVGEEKERLQLTVEVKAVRYIESDYGSKTLYTMLTEDGNVVKWFASKDVLGENVGARFIIRGTVKSHDEWKGMKTTKLTRCSVIDELEPAGE